MLRYDTITRPVYYQIIERRGKIWAFNNNSRSPTSYRDSGGVG